MSTVRVGCTLWLSVKLEILAKFVEIWKLVLASILAQVIAKGKPHYVPMREMKDA